MTLHDGYVAPQLATDHDNIRAFVEGLDPAEWTMEPKLDGHRVIVAVSQGTVLAWSRPGHGKAALPRPLPAHLAAGFSQMPDATFDTEWTIPGGTSSDVTTSGNESKIVAVVFDLPRLLGHDITADTCDHRRAYLEQIFAQRAADAIVLVPQYAPAWSLVRQWWKAGAEGAILKRRSARYRPNARSTDWVKVKKSDIVEMTVYGFKAGTSGERNVLRVVDDAGRQTTVKVRNATEQRKIDQNPDSILHRRILVKYTEFAAKGGYRHGRWVGYPPTESASV